MDKLKRPLILNLRSLNAKLLLMSHKEIVKQILNKNLRNAIKKANRHFDNTK